jgi:hypothetical protein
MSKLLIKISITTIITSMMFVALAFSSPSHASAAPATFTVTNTNDSGAGSLRQAITDANANANPADMDMIEFNISGGGVHTITLATDLPLVNEKATINGYSQPGSSMNTAPSPNPINSVIMIEIAGTNATISHGILGLIADDSIVQGLSIYDGSAPDPIFSLVNVGLIGNNTQVRGSYIGLRADGSTVGEFDKNCAGVVNAGQNVAVGGTNNADRNIVYSRCSLAQSAAVVLNGNAYVYGNYIGLAKDGVTDLTPEALDANGLVGPYSFGINMINRGNNIIGGSSSAKKNVVSGNTANIIISSPNNIIQGNIVGPRYDGQVSSSITNGMGMTSTAGSDSIIGGINPGEGNLIAGVKGSGIEIGSLYIPLAPITIVPSRITALGNSIRAITPFNLLGVGNSNLGIDVSRFTDNDGNFVPEQFDDRGPNPNDSGDNDTGPNGFINTPVLKTAQQISNQLTIGYDLDIADSPSNTYRVEFFANNQSSIFGVGPGETYLGSVTVSPGVDQTATLTISGDYTNMALSSTATAIDTTAPSGFGATSEFSQNISVGSAIDFDSDGAPDITEDSAPNNGDGNNDGTADRLQPTVTSFEIDSTGIYETLVTEGCSENGTVASVDISSLAKHDNGKQYPYGLIDFTLNCSRGDTVTVTKYVFVDDQPISYTLRKYNPNTEVYADVAGSTVVSQTVGSTQALVSTYAITDGGELDDDGQANGMIVDPVGLASTTPNSLADTGDNLWLWFAGMLSLVGAGMYMARVVGRR